MLNFCLFSLPSLKKAILAIFESVVWPVKGSCRFERLHFDFRNLKIVQKKVYFDVKISKMVGKN